MVFSVAALPRTAMDRRIRKGIALLGLREDPYGLSEGTRICTAFFFVLPI